MAEEANESPDARANDEAVSSQEGQTNGVPSDVNSVPAGVPSNVNAGETAAEVITPDT